MFIHITMNNVTLTEKVIKAAYDVHNELGIGFLEKVFENSMVIALEEMGIKAHPQAPVDVYFRKQIVGQYFADLLIEDELIVELKAVKQLQGEHMAQLINYLNATNLKNGLLINFAKPGLEIRRAHN